MSAQCTFIVVFTFCLRLFGMMTRDSTYSAKRILAIVILPVCLSVCLSRPGTDSSPGETETPGFYHITA